MALFNEQRQLRGFLEAIGCTHLADDRALRDERGAQAERRARWWRYWMRFSRSGTCRSGARSCSRAGVTFGAVHSVDEASDDAQFQQIGALVPFADGKGLTISSPFHLDGETKVAPRRAPSVGQHTEEVLRQAGYSAAEVDRLRALGVLG